LCNHISFTNIKKKVFFYLSESFASCLLPSFNPDSGSHLLIVPLVPSPYSHGISFIGFIQGHVFWIQKQITHGCIFPECTFYVNKRLNLISTDPIIFISTKQLLISKKNENLELEYLQQFPSELFLWYNQNSNYVKNRHQS